MQLQKPTPDLFFDDTTREALADLLMPFRRACCLCAPSVAEALYRRGRIARFLDIDERFSAFPGFRRWDVADPRGLPEPFDIVVAAPPEPTAPALDGTARAIAVLAGPDSRVLVAAPCGVPADPLARLGLRATGVRAGCASPAMAEFYANFALPSWFNPARDARPN
jgi:hypothetical protein